MKIINVVTYTSECRESTIQIIRTKKLTIRGAQRIIRRTAPLAFVTKIETLIDKR